MFYAAAYFQGRTWERKVIPYEKGYEITIPTDLLDSTYVAGATLKDGKLLTNGGRVLGVTSIDDTLKGAINKTYEKVKNIKFDNRYYRNDIGAKALKAGEAN